jgi:hypothetical protein
MGFPGNNRQPCSYDFPHEENQNPRKEKQNSDDQDMRDHGANGILLPAPEIAFRSGI